VPDAPHWADLCEALQRECRTLGGFGRISVEVVFQGGLPIEMRVRERFAAYLLGRHQPPLSGRPPIDEPAAR